jgi:hypothetical protein
VFEKRWNKFPYANYYQDWILFSLSEKARAISWRFRRPAFWRALAFHIMGLSSLAKTMGGESGIYNRFALA